MAIRFPKCVLAYLVALTLIVCTNAGTSDEENHPKGTSPSDNPPAIMKPRIVPLTSAEEGSLREALMKTGGHTKRFKEAISKALNNDKLEVEEWLCVKTIVGQDSLSTDRISEMEALLNDLRQSDDLDEELFKELLYITVGYDRTPLKTPLEDKLIIHRIQRALLLDLDKPGKINRSTYKLARAVISFFKHLPRSFWIDLASWHKCADEDSSIDEVDKAMGSLQVGDDVNAEKGGNGSSQVIVKETKISAEQSREGADSAEESTEKRKGADSAEESTQKLEGADSAEESTQKPEGADSAEESTEKEAKQEHGKLV